MSRHNVLTYDGAPSFSLKNLVLDFVPDPLIKLYSTALAPFREAQTRADNLPHYRAQLVNSPPIDIEAMVAAYRARPEMTFGELVGRTTFVSLAEQKAAAEKRNFSRAFSRAYYSRHR